MSEPTQPPPSRRIQAARLWGRERMARLERQRPQHASIEAGFRWVVRDKQIAGGVLGGGLAYRFFFWLLALSVLLSGGLGFASRSQAESAAEDAGLAKAVSGSVATAAQQAQSGRWWLLLIGLYLTLWFSWGLLRALRLVHAAAWRMIAPPVRNAPLAIAVVVASPFVLAAATAAAGWVRVHASPAFGVLATLAAGVVFGAVWLRVSMRLPAPEVPWTAFLPGAVLIGAGVEALHLFTVYFLEGKLADSSQLYGALGLAATVLFYLFLIGRGVVWAAELNAIVWEVWHPAGLPSDGERQLPAAELGLYR